MIIKINDYVTSVLNNTLPHVKNYNVILANGIFPSQKCLRDLMYHANHLICCDGAANKLLDHGMEANFIIGDCDSISNKVKESCSNIVEIKSQDMTDLTKAVNFAKKLKLTNLVILGATGLREDHSTANIALLAEYTKELGLTYMISDYGIFTAHSEDIILDTMPGQQISFLPINPLVQLTCSDLQWKLKNFKFASWNSGTLNQAISNKLNLHVKNGPIVVYRSFEISKRKIIESSK